MRAPARAVSSMSRMTPIYTIYGLLYTTFGLDVRHHPAVWPSCWAHCWVLCIWVLDLWIWDLYIWGSVDMGSPSLALGVTIVVPTRYARGNIYLLGYMGHDWSQQYGNAS
jgi:hypothetical protein